MPKNIVVCCDGTNNQVSCDATNVIRTYTVAVRSSSQMTFYDCGVGTMAEPWVTGKLRTRWSLLKGLAFGSGFIRNIENAYRFLMATYEPGDSVYLFGFSRGAYTVRALAGMLYSVGLLRRGTENLIPYAQRYWQKDFRPSSPGAEVCRKFKATFAIDCPVHFIGVWDTVGSVGFVNQWKTFPFTAHNPGVSYVRHAVSIDERRCFFRQNLMFKAKGEKDDDSTQDIKNVWFAGVHSDVGGGYPPAEAGLAKITFQWMMDEARKCGMRIDEHAMQNAVQKSGAVPDASASQHESLAGGWRLAEWLPVRRYKETMDKTTGQKKIKYIWRSSFGRRRDVKRNAASPEVFLHETVLTRLKAKNDYRPGNIPQTEADLRTLFLGKIEPPVA